jgi:hypothetical protein
MLEVNGGLTDASEEVGDERGDIELPRRADEEQREQRHDVVEDDVRAHDPPRRGRSACEPQNIARAYQISATSKPRGAAVGDFEVARIVSVGPHKRRISAD